MNKLGEIGSLCQMIVTNLSHISRREHTDELISRLRVVCDEYWAEQHPPDLGIHVVEGIKPEKKRGE